MRLRVRHRHKVAMAGNSSCDKGFSSSFMVLKPEQVKFVDLIRILFSSDLEKPNFVDSSAQTEESFGRRWLIFLSISVQKALLFTAKPLAAIGSAVEMSLNVLSSNGNLCKLILNSIQGKAVIPGRESADFYSFIGSIDKRPKLDPNIKRGDPKYNAALSMMASKLSYENKAHVQNTVTNHWQMEFLGFYDYWNDYQEKATTQAFMMRDKVGVENDTIVVAFRGTEPFDADAWCSDFDLSWYEIPGVGKIHGGFMKALGLQKNIGFPRELAKEGACSGRPIPLAYYDIRDRLRDLVRQNNATKFVLTGHSLGGALAILFPAILAWHDDKFLLERLEGVYTFGQPRVGNAAFGEFMKSEMVEHNIRYFRFVYGNDMVPRLPYDDKSFMFKHFGTCLYSDRNYLVQVVDEEPNKNYFSPLNAIPMMINSWGELIRSFSIPYKKGPDFSEGGFLRLFRIIGLLMPGVPAHCPQDYVNSTRFVSNDVFLHPIDSSHKNL